MKNYRHQKIMELIEKNMVETQEELREMLDAEGFPVTQATVSRDIRQLRLRKVSGPEGGQHYVLYSQGAVAAGDRMLRVLRDGFVSMDAAENILVVKTISGMAMAVAAAIDAIQMKEILGCIAGDDTVFCAIRSRDEVLSVMTRLNDMTQ